MHRAHLVSQLETSVKAIACRGLTGLDRAAMERAVEAFIRDDVRPRSAEDILRRFVTSRGTMEEFLCYLDRRICSPSCLGNHDFASSCPAPETKDQARAKIGRGGRIGP